MKRLILGLCVLACVAISGVGVHLVLQQQRRLARFVPTRATILGKRVEILAGLDQLEVRHSVPQMHPPIRLG